MFFIDYVDIAWGGRVTLGKPESVIDHDGSSNGFTLSAHERKTLRYSDEFGEDFGWNDRLANRKNLYLILTIVGRKSPIRIRLYPYRRKLFGLGSPA